MVILTGLSPRTSVGLSVCPTAELDLNAI